MSILDTDGIHDSTTNPRKKMVETCHFSSRWRPEFKSIKIDSSAINKPVDPVVCFRLGFSCWTIKKRPGKLRWNTEYQSWRFEDDFIDFLFNWVIFRFQPLIFGGVLKTMNPHKFVKILGLDMSLFLSESGWLLFDHPPSLDDEFDKNHFIPDWS